MLVDKTEGLSPECNLSDSSERLLKGLMKSGYIGAFTATEDQVGTSKEFLLVKGKPDISSYWG